MAWAKGAWAGLGSGIKSVAEGRNGRCGMVTTHCVVQGAGLMDDATTRGWMMWRIHNREGPKRGGEIRHPAGGIPARSGLRNEYCANQRGYQ